MNAVFRVSQIHIHVMKIRLQFSEWKIIAVESFVIHIENAGFDLAVSEYTEFKCMRDGNDPAETFSLRWIQNARQMWSTCSFAL